MEGRYKYRVFFIEPSKRVVELWRFVKGENMWRLIFINNPTNNKTVRKIGELGNVRDPVEYTNYSKGRAENRTYNSDKKAIEALVLDLL